MNGPVRGVQVSYEEAGPAAPGAVILPGKQCQEQVERQQARERLDPGVSEEVEAQGEDEEAQQHQEEPCQGEPSHHPGLLCQCGSQLGECASHPHLQL